jgi:hypothetical protein
MKIRYGFVTNSSSTSYIFAFKKKPTLNEFFAACGVKPNSKASGMFEDLYFKVTSDSENIKTHWKYTDPDKKFLDVIVEEFSPGVAERVDKLIKSGYSVQIGRLNSDDPPALSFFCCDHFIVDNDDIYLHSLNCVW